MPITPRRASVRPRVVSVGAAASTPQLLEDRVRWWLGQHVTGRIEVRGSLGSGVTTALRHVAAVFEGEARLIVVEVDRGACVVLATPVFDPPTDEAQLVQVVPKLEQVRLAPWTEDDCIEHLLHGHADRCGSVMKRLETAGDVGILGGVPELVTAVLDAMALDESIVSATEALDRHVATLLSAALLSAAPTPFRFERACLEFCLRPDPHEAKLSPLFVDRLRILRHEEAFSAVAATVLVREIVGRSIGPERLQHLRAPLQRRAIPRLREAPQAIEELQSRIVAASPEEGGAIASLLHAADATGFARWIGGYARRLTEPLRLANARLERAPWRGLELGPLVLREADLSAADLRETKLEGAELRFSSLTAADLSGANLANARVVGSTLERARCAGVAAGSLHLSLSHAPNVDFTDGHFDSATFERSVLNETSFRGASLVLATFSIVTLDEVNFERAVLRGADFTRCDLRTCLLREANFEQAKLVGVVFEEADLEAVCLARADLSEAILHGAKLRRADLSETRLVGARLSQVDAEGASFRNADFAGASFHLGSTRSGLVLNAPPMEGSKTGFYRDDFFASLHRRPEDVRVANLCGADLLGAKVEATDFYLVDLRGALFDGRQMEHFRRCGAILRDRSK